MSKLLPRHTHSGVQSGSDGEVAPGFHMASVSEVCIKKIILKFNYGGLKEKNKSITAALHATAIRRGTTCK